MKRDSEKSAAVPMLRVGGSSHGVALAGCALWGILSVQRRFVGRGFGIEFCVARMCELSTPSVRCALFAL